MEAVFTRQEASDYIILAMRQILSREGYPERLRAFLEVRHEMKLGNLTIEVALTEAGDDFIDMTLKVWEVAQGVVPTPVCTFPLIRKFKLAPWVGVDSYRLATQVAMEWEEAKRRFEAVERDLKVKKGAEVVVGDEVRKAVGSCILGIFAEEGDIGWEEVTGVLV